MRHVLLLTLFAAGCAGELEEPDRFADCPPGFVEQMFANLASTDDPYASFIRTVAVLVYRAGDGNQLPWCLPFIVCGGPCGELSTAYPPSRLARAGPGGILNY